MAKKDKDKEKKEPRQEAPAPEITAEEATPAEEETQQGKTLTPEELEEVKKLYDTVGEQQKKLEENKDQYLRLCADFDNFRKRSQKEKEALYTDVKAEAVKALLPVYDNLERALAQSCADEAFKKGVEMTMTQFDEILKGMGVEEVEALGQPFDPELHNAVMHEENGEFGENTVSLVLQKGFKMKDKIIRFAMVKVAN